MVGSSKSSTKKPAEEAFRLAKVGGLSLSKPVTALPETPLGEVLSLLRGDCGGCVILVEEAKAVGIFTERDYLDKIAGLQVEARLEREAEPIKNFMTALPKTLSCEETLDAGIRLMTKGGYRHLPLVNEDGHLVGVLSVRNIIHFLAELFPTEIINWPPRLDQRLGSREGE